MTARRKNSLSRQVRRAYSQESLARICTMPEREFGSAFGMQTVETRQREPDNYYHFRDNGSRVLAVAHLDTVVSPKQRKPHFYNTKSGPVIVSGALDDRLGAYVILSLLPELGVTCDWLLTTGEEYGQSTAEFFDHPDGKEYDWVIEFDRGGTDVVMYEYEDKASREAVQACGAVVGRGSFSDICSLEHLHVKAFNWGVGYKGDYHSKDGYACLYDTFAMTAKYLQFHAQNSGTAMPHEPAWRSYGPSWSYDNDNNNSPKYLDCEFCGYDGAVDPDTLLCENCRCCLVCGQKKDKCPCFGDEPRQVTDTELTIREIRAAT